LFDDSTPDLPGSGVLSSVSLSPEMRRIVPVAVRAESTLDA
jgi:hypothetical protein